MSRLQTKQLSKALVIALVVACAVAFMPLLNGQAFAASKVKKPKSLKVVQVKDTMTAKATWKKGTNNKKYNVKVDGVVVASKIKAKSYTTEALTAGEHTIAVQGVNGKKKSGWTSKKVTIVPIASKVTVTGASIIGQTLTATVYGIDDKPITEGLTYQWYRINNSTGIVAAIPAATASAYQIVAADENFTIFVEVTVGGQKIESAPTKAVSDFRELGSAEIVLPNGHTAPQMGDVLTLKAKDNVGDDVDLDEVDIQWYVGGKKIAGANDATYQIPETDVNKGFIGKVVTVTVTAKENSYWYAGEVTSVATAPIIKSTVPTGIKIEGSANAPFIGDELEAVFTPEGAFDADATYQWFRDGKKIAGATAAKYTVTKTDKGSILSVKAKLSTDKSTSEFTDGIAADSAKVKEPLTGATVTVASHAHSSEAAHTGKRAAVFTTSDDAVATVTIDPEVTVEGMPAYTYKWYVDSVAVENQLFADRYDTTQENFEQTAAGETGTLALTDDTYYPYRGITKLDSLVGHKLIAVAVTTTESSVQGSVTSEATAAVTISVEGVKVTIGPDATSDGKLVVGKTTLTSTLTGLPEDATVTYQWYKYDSDEETYVAIDGATASTYAVATADIGTGVKFKLVVTGTGDYYGAPSGVNDLGYTIVKNDGQKVNVTLSITNGETSDIQDGTAQPGDVLTAVPSVASADTNKALTYTWTYEAAGEDAVTATGKEYTVPANAKANATITLSAVSGLDDYVVNKIDNKWPKVTVKTPLTSVLLESHSTWKASTTAAGHDGLAAPNVGETLEATAYAGTVVASDGVSYKWYADGKQIKDGEATFNGSKMTIGKAQFGKVITVEAIGDDGRAYAGSKVASAASGTVGAVGKVVVYDANGKAVDKDTTFKVGDKVTAKVNEYIYDATGKKPVPVHALAAEVGKPVTITELANIAWNVGGAEAGTGASYTFVADDEGSAWTCVASGIEPAFEGALSYSNNLVVYPADWLVPAYAVAADYSVPVDKKKLNLKAAKDIMKVYDRYDNVIANPDIAESKPSCDEAGVTVTGDSTTGFSLSGEDKDLKAAHEVTYNFTANGKPLTYTVTVTGTEKPKP